MYNVLVVAGEKSGEEHFISLIKDFQRTDLIKFFGVGGREMKAAGVECLYDLNTFSSMGFSEPIKKLPFYIDALRNLVAEAKRRNTKYAILIDFQEFNLKLAEKLSICGIRVLYYVAPQAWAWRPGRCKKLSLYTHRLFTILPFEQKWFSARGVKNIIACQHPVFKEFKNQKINIDHLEEKRSREPTILFLPGSRNSEVSKLLPVYIKLIKKLKELELGYQFSLVISDSITVLLDSAGIEKFDKVYTNNELDEALAGATFCISASGTVNLNCAFYRIPTIVCYDASRINYFLAREVIGYKGFASLVNIISQEELFPELLQDKFNIHNLMNILLKIINNKVSEDIKQQLDLLYERFDRGESRPGAVIEEVILNEK